MPDMESVETMPVVRAARRMSHVLKIFAICLGLLVLAGGLWLAVAPQALGAFLSAGVWAAPIELTTGQILGLSLLALTGFVGWICVIWMAQSLFTELAAGAPQAAAQWARRIAVGLWVLLLWHLLAQAIGSAIATWHFAPGQRAIVLNLGFGHLGMLLAALMATTMSKAFEFGAALWHDHKAIV